MKNIPLKTLINLIPKINNNEFEQILKEAAYRYIEVKRLHTLNIYKIRSSNFSDDIDLKEQFSYLLANLESFPDESVHIHIFDIDNGAVFLFSNVDDDYYLGHLFIKGDIGISGSVT